jgi:hypothetical protein
MTTFDTHVFFATGPETRGAEMAAHEALILAAYHISARRPFLIVNEADRVLAAFSERDCEVSGDSYFVDVLRSHSRLFDQIARDLLVGIAGK